MSKVFNEILHCNVCADHKPFHFELGSQKIMLISFAPSYGVLSRPLYYIQLFRRMCLALFGDVAPTEEFIREFYDPSGNIYWTHYHKCYKDKSRHASPSCEPLLIKEIETLDPDIIIILGADTARNLFSDKIKMNKLRQELPKDVHPYLSMKKDGSARQVFITGLPSDNTAANFEEIRRSIKPYINWVKVECENLDFSSANFIDLEYATIEYLKDSRKSESVKLSEFEHAWLNGIILPNVESYNLVLQVFIFIESNIKNLLMDSLETHDDIDKRWFSPFRDLVNAKLSEHTQSAAYRRALNSLITDIDSLHALRNVITHKSGVVSDHDEMRSLRNIEKIKRLKGVYIYGGNSIFISNEGVANIMSICDGFRSIFKLSAS